MPQGIDWVRERDLVRKAGTGFLENLARDTANEVGAVEDEVVRL
jgi:hypothetical protein